MLRILVSLTLAASLVSCGDTASSGTVVFGEGQVPEAIPSDFPIPADAVIGSTLIDTINSKSQFEYRTAAEMSALVQALSVQLVERGYVIESSSGDVSTWQIEFRRDGLEGDVQLRSVGPGVSQAAVTVNDA